MVRTIILAVLGSGIAALILFVIGAEVRNLWNLIKSLQSAPKRLHEIEVNIKQLQNQIVTLEESTSQHNKELNEFKHTEILILKRLKNIEALDLVQSKQSNRAAMNEWMGRRFG